ncbi:MAG: hypothetical protein MI975_02875 [Cytophagales bacterium]|nr:hypothetical protein [Cytophagales bacterium]
MNKQKVAIYLFGMLLWGCSNRQEIKNIEVFGVENPIVLLNGTWKFSMVPPEKFWENDVDFQRWSDILVPGECQMQGFAIKHDRPYAYKTTFQVPPDYLGQQILLNFYGVYSYARVWVNGQFVRDHFGGFTKRSCDITGIVSAGEKAILTVEIVDRTDDISYGSGYAKHQIGGILRDVELAALPKQNFRKLHFETDLDENYKNAELKVAYELNQNSPVKIKIKLLDAKKNLVMALEEEAKSQSGQISIPIENPRKWDAEHPNLYTVITSLIEHGETTFKISKNIGFREVVLDRNRLLVNGKPACRFDKIDGENILFINDMWDYNSLLWGNYMKLIPSENEWQGQIFMKISN